MSQSVSELLKASGALEVGPKRARASTAKWVRICVCGHPERKHPPGIGGTAKVEFNSARKTMSAPGCIGENRRRNADPIELLGKVADPDSPTGERALILVIPTCPCTEFRPVVEAKDARYCFFQKRPTTTPRSHKRDRDPARHPLMVGLRAMRTSVTNSKEIRALRDMDARGADIEDRIDELVESRIRFLPEWKCFVPKCAGAGALPVFIDDEDTTELRCSRHLPAGVS